MVIAASVWLGLVALLWLLILVRVHRESGETPYRVGPEDPAATGRVSVVIPARDEARNIEAAVRAVWAQDLEVQLVVLDDGSTDGTGDLLARLAGEGPLTLLTGGDAPLPEGWLGKPWACQRAARHATGDWLLFIDADVRLAPTAVSRALAYAREHELHLLSGLGSVESVTLAERVLQPAITGLVVAGNDLREVNDPQRPDKALANGQFLLFSREGYVAIGGHEAVRGNVVDDVGLALAVKGAGLRYHLVFMRHLFACRMYTSGAEVWAGWRKNLFAGLRRSWRALLTVELGLLLVVVGPYVALLVGLVAVPSLLWAAVPAVLAQQAVRWRMDTLFGLSRAMGVVGHALGYALVMVLLVDSAVSTVRGRATWKGRVV